MNSGGLIGRTRHRGLAGSFGSAADPVIAAGLAEWRARRGTDVAEMHDGLAGAAELAQRQPARQPFAVD